MNMTRARCASAGSLLVAVAASALLVAAVRLPATAGDNPKFDELELTLTGGAYSMAIMDRDSDGDGWTDWRELLEGTDPQDPKSHPLATVVEFVGTTAYLQSVAFPDRLAVVDLQPPEQVAGKDLISTLGPLLGFTAGSKLHQQLTDDLDRLVGSGLLEEILSAADKAHGHGDAPGDAPGRRTNGMDLSLISDGFSDHPTVSGGVTNSGHPWISIDDGAGVTQRHVWGEDIKSWVWTRSTDAGGNVSVEMTYAVNGLVLRTVRTTVDANGNIIEEIEYDGAGNVVSKNGVPVNSSAPQPNPAQTSAAPGGNTASASASPSEAASPSSGSSGGASETPSASSSGYVDPDAGTYGGGIGIPTPREVAARVAFLSGVRARFADRGPLSAGTVLITDKPGVADPAEPECRDERCVVFVEVAAPRLGNVPGGDPVNPDWGGGVPRP